MRSRDSPRGASDESAGGEPRQVVVHIDADEVSLVVDDLGGDGPAVLLLHGLAGSSRELLPTAYALRGSHRVLVLDQRGHGRSTRRPTDLSRDAFVRDVVAVLDELLPTRECTLVGQSMGAHTAFLVAAAHPDRIRRLVMLEGHASGSVDPDEAANLGSFFANWPLPFADEDAAREHLGNEAIASAWIDDLESVSDGLRPRFDADIMQGVIEAVHVPRWREWEALKVPTTAIFARAGLFSEHEKDELIRRRPATQRIDLQGGNHDAHLDAFDEWIDTLRGLLTRDEPTTARSR